MANDEERTVTGAYKFFQSIYNAGVRYCFVNLGSDHPAMVEALAAAKADETVNMPTIITCPSEMVALSAALGYAQVTGMPQCVIVHVDCGTLAMGQSIHNGCMARVPVLMFAGLTPVTQEGELLGSRTEFIHWIQDVPDQGAIVRQYCRYTGELRVAQNIGQVVNRALQISKTDPKGPVYLTACREVLEQTVKDVDIDQERWDPAILGLLPETDVKLIAEALLQAERPLLITGYLGRNARNPPLLEALCNKLPIEVLETIGSDLAIRSSHEAYRGVAISTHAVVKEADVIIVIDCDVPWVPVHGTPSKKAKIFHLDVDPLKPMMTLYYIDAHRRYRVNSEEALKQLNSYLASQNVDATIYAERFKSRSTRYKEWRQTLLDQESPCTSGTLKLPYFVAQLREALPKKHSIVIEAVTNAITVLHHLNLTEPGSLYGSGCGGLGWLGGAALGVKLAKPQDFICAIVGDGSFLFSQMESAFWISRRYKIPFLLIVLNNGGWNAPKVSALLVHQNGMAAANDRKYLNMSFEPSPDYAGIAAAAGGAWGAKVIEIDQVKSTLKQAIDKVQAGQSAVVEVRIPPMWPEKDDVPSSL
ncbi:putative thiamine pyrophosphate enzyme [Tothia fuscella]|uniref:Thiamine pyrophosphate enzyme n=1 Tax=Tothia fuscella TaxID=1048955 RepID=A0A9P4TVH8_9PEZI|nr:putative thiamine pyrophosphate enzyme [Tothia fuscella]